MKNAALSTIAALWPKQREAIARRIAPTQPQEPANDAQQLLGTGDLARRWSYTRQGIYKLQKRDDFPRPAVVLAGGRLRAWAAADIEAYERDRPELHSEDAKLKKVRGFYRARRKGPQP